MLVRPLCLLAAVAVAPASSWAADPPPAEKGPDKPADKGAEKPAAAAAPAAKSEVPVGDAPAIPFTKATFDNGLELLFHEDRRLPVVCVDVWYHVGALHEEKGKTGFAHLFEHLMFQGTPHVVGDAHFKLLEQAGASEINGTTDFDRTNYFECVPKNELELALWLESDRMGWLMQAVDKAKLDEQRNVVKNERRQSLENVPYGAAEEKIWQTMLPKDHPYWGYVIGSMQDLDNASLADVAKFYDTYYAPSNATVAVVGDVDLNTAKLLVEKFFKTLPKWPKPALKQIPLPSLAAEVRVDAEDALAQVPKVEVLYFLPPAFQPGNAEGEVMARLLGDGNSSKLHQALVVDGKMAQEVSGSLYSLAGVSVMVLTATVRPGVDTENVVNAIESQIALLKDLPPSAEEVGRAVTTIEAEKVFALQQPLARAETLQFYNHYTQDPGGLGKDLARYRAVTPEALQAAAVQHLAKERRGVLVVKPRAAAAAAPAAPAPAKETK